MSIQEFDHEIEAGKKYVILDDYVLDCSRFMKQHPGGLFLISQHIGRDVSKFFYGGYKLEAKASKGLHKHSNTAYSIVR